MDQFLGQGACIRLVVLVLIEKVDGFVVTMCLGWRCGFGRGRFHLLFYFCLA